MTAMLVTRVGHPLIAIRVGPEYIRSSRDDHLLESEHSRRSPSGYFRKVKYAYHSLMMKLWETGNGAMGEGGNEAEMEERENHDET